MALIEHVGARPFLFIFDSKTATPVLDTGDTVLIGKREVFGMNGNFFIQNRGANTIVLFPRHSNDGTKFAEIDNGTGISLAAGAETTLNFVGGYRFIRLDATAVITTNDVDSSMYVSQR